MLEENHENKEIRVQNFLGDFAAKSTPKVIQEIAQLEKVAEANLDAEQQTIKHLIEKPQYRHELGISYLLTTPYFRIEFNSSPDSPPGSGLLKLVLRGHFDGERDDAKYVTFLVKDYRLESYDDPERMPVFLAPNDKTNFFVKYLLAKGFITQITEPPPHAQLAQSIYAIAAVTPQQRESVDFKSIDRADKEATQARFVIDEGDKKIITRGLANCVAVTLYDPKTHRGAVAHFDPNQQIGSMLNDMLGTFQIENPARVEARLIGGWSGYSEKTVYYLRQGLQNRGLPIISEDILGESVSRAVMLDTKTGKVTYLKID